jgi:hypothetical protein
MTNDGALMVLLGVLAGVLGLYLTFAPTKRAGRRLLGVLLVLCAAGGGFLLVAGAGLAQVASH